MLLDLTETPQGFVLSYPAWIAFVFVVAALAAAYALVWRPDGSTKRRLGGCLAVLFLSAAASYFGSYTARFDDTTASLSAFPRYDLRVDWRDVRGVRLERSRSKGSRGHVLMIATAGGLLEFNIADLSDAGLRRLMPYVEAQVAATRQPATL